MVLGSVTVGECGILGTDQQTGLFFFASFLSLDIRWRCASPGSHGARPAGETVHVSQEFLAWTREQVCTGQFEWWRRSGSLSNGSWLSDCWWVRHSWHWPTNRPFFLLLRFFPFFLSLFRFFLFFLERDCLLCAICDKWLRAWPLCQQHKFCCEGIENKTQMFYLPGPSFMTCLSQRSTSMTLQDSSCLRLLSES